MGIGAAIAAIGVGISAVSAIGTYRSQQTMIDEQRTAGRRAENVRYQQMYLDSQRRKRQSVRESLMARATALSTGANQGAMGSSGLAAALGQTNARSFENQGTVNASTVLGQRMFSANNAYSEATFNGQSGMALWQGVGSFGKLMAQSGQTIQSLGQQMVGAG